MPPPHDQVSTATVQRALHEHGYFSRVGVCKPWTNEINWTKCYTIAKEHAASSDAYWQSVIQSDESRFTLWLSDGPVCVWQQTKEKYDVDCLVLSGPSRSKGVIVWGC